MKSLYNVVEGILDVNLDSVDKAAEKTASINKTKSELGAEFRKFIESKFGVKFEIRDKKDRYGGTIQEYCAVKPNVSLDWWKNNKTKLKKMLDVLGAKSAKKAAGYTHRNLKYQVHYHWQEDFVCYTAGSIFYDMGNKSILFVASL